MLDELVESGQELGLQVAAYRHGELVIDAWAGVSDRAAGRRVDGGTLFTVFSTTKGITATALHLLAERGKIDYDAPIARYWPEFAANGKGAATVRHALAHQAGIPLMPVGATPEMMCDWKAMCDALGAMAPIWKPGTKTGYHAYTFGWILGEVVRRVDGRPIAAFVRDEICRPLAIDSLFLGIPDEVEPRVATLENAPPDPDAPAPPVDSLMTRAIPPALGTTGAVFNRPDVRRASIPAAGGIMNARSIARHYAALAEGGALDGVRLMSKARIDVARTLQTEDTDQVLGTAPRKSLGYFLGAPLSPMGDNATAFGHPGAGGSIGFADPENHLAFGYAKNLLKAGAPGQGSAVAVAAAVRAVLGIGVG